MACQSMRARCWRTHSRRKSSYLFAWFVFFKEGIGRKSIKSSHLFVLFVFVTEGNGRKSIKGVKTRVHDTRRIKQRTTDLMGKCSKQQKRFICVVKLDFSIGWRIPDETAKKIKVLLNLTHIIVLFRFFFSFSCTVFVIFVCLCACLSQVALLRGWRYSAFLEPIELIIFFVIGGVIAKVGKRLERRWGG